MQFVVDRDDPILEIEQENSVRYLVVESLSPNILKMLPFLKPDHIFKHNCITVNELTEQVVLLTKNDDDDLHKVNRTERVVDQRTDVAYNDLVHNFWHFFLSSRFEFFDQRVKVSILMLIT